MDQTKIAILINMREEGQWSHRSDKQGSVFRFRRKGENVAFQITDTNRYSVQILGTSALAEALEKSVIVQIEVNGIHVAQIVIPKSGWVKQ